MKPSQIRLMLSIVLIFFPRASRAQEQPEHGCWNAGPPSCSGERTTALSLPTGTRSPPLRLPSSTPVNPKKHADATHPPVLAQDVGIQSQRSRTALVQPRIRALLMQDIQSVEGLINATLRDSADRPELLRRLADDYAELAAAAMREKTEAEIRKNKPEADKAARTVALARQNAIQTYTRLKDQHPTYKKLDEVLYYLAFESEQASNVAAALSAYRELIQKAPTSKHIPRAYLAFGELFFSQAQGDPSKFDVAKQAYLEVVKYPPPDNAMFGYAHYKLAYVFWNQGDQDPQNYARALQHFKEAIRFGQRFAHLPNSSQVAAAARKDLIPVYALSGRPERAFDLFKDLAGEAANGSSVTYDMMDNLGQNYLDTGHYPEAISLYQDLMKRDHGVRRCRYHSRIVEGSMVLHAGAKDRIQDVLNAQLAVHREYRASAHPAEDKLRCANVTADLLTETAMAWHLEAVGMNGVRGTNDAKTLTLAGQLYRKVVDSFTADDFSRFEFPRIVRQDWPSLAKVRYAMADLFYHQQRWEECAPAFDAVVGDNPIGSDAAEAAYSAALCYQNLYLQRHRGGSDRKGTGMQPGSEHATADEATQVRSLPFDDLQKRMVKAFEKFLCIVEPSKGDKAVADQIVDIKFAWARTHFEAHHWNESAAGFRDIALHHPDNGAGIHAAHLYLESANVLGLHMEPHRPDCLPAMSNDITTFLSLYCTEERRKGNEDGCQRLSSVQANVKRMHAEMLIKQGDRELEAGKTTDALAHFQNGAEELMSVWQTFGELPILAGNTLQAERLDEVLYNAARAYQAAHLLAKAIAVRMILVDPRWGLNRSASARKALFEIGSNFQAIAVYDQAAEWYERFAKAAPSEPKADIALSDAVVLRLGLGEEAQAIRDAKAFSATFGNRRQGHNAQIAFAVAAHFVEQKDWVESRNRLQAAMPLVDTSAPLDVRVQAHAMLARVDVQLRATPQAEAEYRKARDLWGDERAVRLFLEEAKDDPRRVGKALTAVGEAMFFFAEQVRTRTVETLRMPTYDQPGYAATDPARAREETARVQRHVETRLKPWVQNKSKAIEMAEVQYKTILDLKPAPPPRWVIAAASRSGSMWSDFVADFAKAPIPRWMETDPELHALYLDRVRSAGEPIKLRAKSAFQTCLDRSVQYQFFDQYSRSCEEWLALNYRSEYHLVDEFRGSPNAVGSGLNDRPPLLTLSGQPHVQAPISSSPAKQSVPDPRPAHP